MAIPTCAVTGNVKNLVNSAVQNCNVKVSVVTPFFHTGVLISGEQASVTTNSSGDFSVSVVETETVGQKVTFTFDYYDGVANRRTKQYTVVVPNSSTAVLADLVTAAAFPATITTFPASNVTVSTISGLTADNAQDAFAEHQTDIVALQAGAVDAAAHIAASTGVHGVTGAVVGTTNSQTLTNKTLTAPVIATISNTGTLTLPTSSDTLVGRATTDTLTNKTLTSPSITTPTGIVKGDVGLGNVDNTSDAAKNAASVTLTNKTLTSPVINTPTGIVKGDVGLGNVDNTSDATKNAAAVTLTNKTLTSPVINSPTGIVKGDVGLGNVDNTSDATKDAAATTLTNKTISGASNTLSSIADTSLSTIATAGKVSNSATTATSANTNSAIVARDGSGNFSAGTITAALTGSASGNLSATANNHGTLVSGAANVATVVAPGTSGFVLTSNGASSDPSYQAVPSSPSAAYELSNLALATSVASNALTIALKQSDGSTDPSTGSSAVKIGFRSSTVTSGAYNQRSVTAALSLVVSSGSTLGQTSALAGYLYVYALDNAGTVELAVSGTRFSDLSVQSTTAEGGAGAADSIGVLYSATARTGVPIRLIGRILITEATAGTWASNATEISLNVRTPTPMVPTVQRFTTGSGTYTTPAGVVYLKVTCVGGGGGGSGSGSASGGTGGTGGNSTFGSSLLTANGGAGGAFAGNGTAGGTVTVAAPALQLVTATGGCGQGGGGNGNAGATNTDMPGGQGGASALGGNGGGGWAVGAGVAGVTNTGGGGGGGGANGVSSGVAGTGGSAGGYLVAVIPSPSSTYAYAVGAGGTQPGAGTGGNAGGVGGSGLIIVEEYYQ